MRKSSRLDVRLKSVLDMQRQHTRLLKPVSLN
jgi:hypothetical protein